MSSFLGHPVTLYIITILGVDCRHSEQQYRHQDVERVEHGQTQHEVVETLERPPREHHPAPNVPRHADTAENNLQTLLFSESFEIILPIKFPPLYI